MADTLISSLPPVYKDLLSPELEKPAVKETRADCANCQMCNQGTMPAEAEAVFRKDLEKNRRKGRALYGLHASLEKQGNASQARFIERGFAKAWENSDTELTPESIWWVSKN